MESAAAAHVSALDAALQHGIGLFETMFARGFRVHRLREHLDRIAESAAILHLSQRLDTDLLEQAILQTVQSAGSSPQRVRLTVTGGDLNLLRPGQTAPPNGTVIITSQPATPYPDAMFENGVLALISDNRLSPFDQTAGHKTINYWSRLRVLQDAGAAGAGEALWFSVTNHLMGGSVSNLFLIKGEVLHTPVARGEEETGAIPSPVLPGIARAAILEFADQFGIRSRRLMLTIGDLLDADEVFLTNSSWGVLPVVRVERETIGNGSVGQLTRRFRTRWLADLPDAEPDVFVH